MIGKTILHYKILAKLGEGGMGVVYKAEDTKLERLVAIKFLPPRIAANDDEHQRFKIEAKAAAALNHPNIATIHAIEEADGETFIVMEFIDGQELRKLLIDNGQLSIANCLNYATQIAEGLKAAHAKGITHRDVKSSNIMVTESGQVKIMDFGLAKMGVGAHLTKTGTTLGTVAYMSPEQMQGKEVDHRTDIWSFGVVLYEMLTGQLPFRGEYELAMMYLILNVEPQPISDLRTEVPLALQKIVGKALAKAPEKRFDSAQSMIQDLQNARASTSSPPMISSRPTPAPRKQETPSDQLRKAERRQATILISQLAGYTELVEQLAPEEIETVMNQIRDGAAAIVQTHGGVINRFAGDEMVALFGIPTSHEDDFVRAVRAALALHAQVHDLSIEIKSRTGQIISLQSGINTGAIVAQWRGDGERKYEITGSAFQMAAILAAQAEAGEILVGPEHQRLVAPFFETEACAPVVLKGKAQSITPYRVRGESGLHTRLEAAERTGLTPYTGREKELQTLQDCLDKARRGEGQFVAVVGEAGAGKSRLLLELRRELDREAIQLVQGRCHAHGSDIPYLPFVESLRNILQLRENDSPASLLETAVAGIGAIDASLKDFMPLYLHLLSLHSEAYPLPGHLQGENLRHAMLEGLCAIFTLNAMRGPTVMFLEDWHWTDEASLEVLKQLAEMASAYSLLVVATYRPEGALDWSNLSHHTLIHLGPLEVSPSLRIMKSVLGAENFPEELGKRIHERTGGNPFFLEEICQTLVEEGTLNVEQGQAILAGSLEKLHLPDTVEAVIRARLDRLDHEAKELLCLAAVVGREFNREILQRTLADDAHLLRSLETLKALGLIQQIRVRPEATYKFKHALTQEVAYESLLQHQRKSLHGLVGKAIEELHPDRLEEHWEVLAHHFSQAENWPKAVHYGRASAQKTGEFPEALNLLDKTRQWLLKLADDRQRQEMLIDILLQQERVCETLGERERQQRIIDELLALLEPAQDHAKLAMAYCRQGELYALLNRCDEAEAVLNKSLRLSRALGDTVAERSALRSLGFLYWHQGRNEEAVATNEAALAINRQNRDTQAIAGDLTNLGNILRHLGEYDRALKCLEEALAHYDVMPSPVKHASTLYIVGSIHREQGEYDKALLYIQRAMDLSIQHRNVINQSFCLITTANIYWEQGKIEDSLRGFKEAVDLNRKTKYADGFAVSLRMLGEALLALERHAEALPYFREGAALFAQLARGFKLDNRYHHLEQHPKLHVGIELVTQMADHQTEALMWSKVAGICEHEKNHPEAMAAWAQARALRKMANNDPGELEALEGMARVSRLIESDPSVALQYYREALALAEKIQDRAKEAGVLNSMGIIEWNRGEFDQALQHYEKALGIFRELGNQVHAGLMLNSIGVTLQRLGRHEEALARLEEALELHGQTQQALLQGHALATMAGIHHDMGRPDEALHCYESSLKIRRELGDRKGEGWMLYHLAAVHASQGARDRADDCAAQAMKIAAECKDEKLREACGRLQVRS